MSSPDPLDNNKFSMSAEGIEKQEEGIPTSIEPLKRFHDPKTPIKRSNWEYLGLWVGECLAMAAVVYLLSVYGGGVYSLATFSEMPQRLQLIPFSFWLSFWAAGVLAKIFRRGSAFFGAMLGEILLEFVFAPRIQPVLVGFLGWAVLLQSIKPYRGGDFYKADKVFQQIGLLLIIVIGYLPILYGGYLFGGVEPPDFPLSMARGYLLLVFVINGMIPIIPIWATLWLLDKRLVPFFPLSKEDQEKLAAENLGTSNLTQELAVGDNMAENSSSDLLESYFPQPGELYNDLLTHHPLDKDDHTIVVRLGQVRVYLCTRCTGMIYGIFLALFLTQLIMIDMGFIISGAWALWLAIILPLTTIIDWGLQALHIRPARTLDRFITGFLLGVSIHLLTFAREYRYYILAIVAVYFVVFGVLAKIRARKQDQLDAQEYLTKEVLNK